MAVSDSLRCCCVGGCPVVIGGLACHESGNWRCPRVSLCPMPGSDPKTNGDLSADIRRLEGALTACALQVKTVKHCQDELDAEAQKPAQGAD